MNEERVFKSYYPKGLFQDSLLGPTGDLIWQRPWQSNVIVVGLRTVLAQRAKGEGEPINFWAVGSGEVIWDEINEEPPSPTARVNRTALFNETFRKPIPLTQIEFVGTGPSNQIQIQMEFTTDELPPDNVQLREFGLFSSEDNSPNSGFMINHRIHPRIDMQEGFTLQRTLRLTF
jgi:hypothetical protein